MAFDGSNFGGYANGKKAASCLVTMTTRCIFATVQIPRKMLPLVLRVALVRVALDCEPLHKRKSGGSGADNKIPTLFSGN